jgi:hypothetical protein
MLKLTSVVKVWALDVTAPIPQKIRTVQLVINHPSLLITTISSPLSRL